MIRWITLGCVWCVLLAVPPAEVFAQFNPYWNRFDPYAPGADPRIRRAWREQAVARVGPVARALVEAYGDEAVCAIFACSPQVGWMLAQFHASANLDKLPRPRGLLAVIAQPRHGDYVALWAMQHAEELRDIDSFDAYLLNPLEYALGLKQLAAGAAEVRARRGNQGATKVTRAVAALSANARLVIAGAAGGLVLVGLLLWRRKNSGIC